MLEIVGFIIIIIMPTHATVTPNSALYATLGVNVALSYDKINVYCDV